MKENDYLIRIGKNITKVRKEQGLTTNELAHLCEMEKSNLIPIEKGRINVTINTLLKICKALKIDLIDLLS